MIIEATGDPIANWGLVRQHRGRQSRHTMLHKTVIVLAASAVLGVAAIASNAALAFGAFLLSPGSPVLLLRSMVLLPARGLFLIPASVPLPILAPEVVLKPAPVVLVVSLISGVPLVCVMVVAAFRVIFMAALRAWAAATAAPQRPTTDVTGGEIATMASMSTAMLARPMPMTAATTPTATGDIRAF